MKAPRQPQDWDLPEAVNLMAAFNEERLDAFEKRMDAILDDKDRQIAELSSALLEAQEARQPQGASPLGRADPGAASNNPPAQTSEGEKVAHPDDHVPLYFSLAEKVLYCVLLSVFATLAIFVLRGAV